MDLWTTSHGLFRCWPEAVEGSGMRLRVLRAAPDLAKAEEKPVEGVWTRPAVRSVADDGRWLLVEEEPYDNPPRPDRFSLVSLADGRTHPIAPPAGVELDRAVGFLAGERGLLFDTPDGLRLFAPRTDRWCLLHPRGVPASCNVYGLSASPSGRYLAYWDDETYVWWCVDLDDPAPVIGSPDPATVPAHSLDWLGDDRLLLLLEDGWWIVNRDGTGKRRLLPRD
jgi:hypothetical protein